MSNSFSFEVEKLKRWTSKIDQNYQLSKLSKMQTRRMTELCKIAVDLALCCVEDSEIDFIVYSSRHGELNLSFDLIQSILVGEVPSPLKFSQSTHNTMPGHFSILGQLKVPSTAVSAGQDSFKMGLVAASNHLHSFPDHRVLFVFADAAVPPAYMDKVEKGDSSRVVCALLKTGGQFEFELSAQVDDLDV